jgi:hypothetical protein
VSVSRSVNGLPMRGLLTFSLVILGCAAAGSSRAQTSGIVEYTAEYEVRYNGRRVARAEFSVQSDTNESFIFNSTTRARGVWRLASPKPAIERSRFRINGTNIMPIEFQYEDGSRKGEDNYALAFDPAAAIVVLTSAAGKRTVAMEEGLLDRGSLQVALMRDLGRCAEPGPYRYIDDDGTIKTYRYERLDDLIAETGAGAVNTMRLSQHREGSSRTTILWLAPDLGYLPVRIEQVRDGEIETVFSLEDAQVRGNVTPRCP